MNGFEETGRDGEADRVALVARVRAGDREAWGQLYQQCRPAVTRYLARRMDTCPADVEDVVQETFIRLPQMAQTFDPATYEVRAWLCARVARWTMVDHFRKQRFRQHSAVDASRETARMGSGETADEREARPLSARMVTALARLTPAQRRGMQLRYVDQLSTVDAARAAKSSTGAIATNCVAARKRLRADLADLAPKGLSWVHGLSKKHAIQAAFVAVGEPDAQKAIAWLREHDLEVDSSYVYAIRNGRRGSVPASTSASPPRAGVAGGEQGQEEGLIPRPTRAGDDRTRAQVAGRVSAHHGTSAAESGQAAAGRGSWALARAASAGDRAAFGELYSYYRPQVERLVRSRVRDAVLAEDLTSETFTRALARIDSVSERPGRDLGAWLSTIAGNLVRDHAKSADSRLSQAVGEIPEPRAAGRDVPSAETQALDRIGREQAVRAVRDAVAGLRPAHQDAVQAVMEDRSAGEQARRTGVSRAAAWAMRQRTMTALREHFTREGFTSSQDCAAGAAPRPCHSAGRDDAGRDDAETDPAGTGEAAAAVEHAEHGAAVARARRAVEHVSGQRAAGPAGDESARVGQLALWHIDDQATQAEDTITTAATEDWTGESYGRDGAQ